jgi:hypothetical protein
MALEYKFGLMVQSMKVNGNTIKHMVRENFIMQMVIYLKEIGKMIWLMVMVFIITLMVLVMKANGFVINNMDMV